MAVYGIVNGRVYQAAVSEETSKHQLSWQLEHDESSAQTFEIVIYDEDGLTAYRKVSGLPTSVYDFLIFGVDLVVYYVFLNYLSLVSNGFH